ncbi:type II secretion system minor pseudopilin GspI [Marinobacter sp. JSM 1782161]|uniref:type II secretion system minor pseudopilin GspI n=1 Tax=Marinobacter sp. JSM 1782161 TaxID=2685906 RepID=UPI001A9D49E3|nr:type II secretion system minor pseudopilin GspI [Marinobacter sp. JSM 1782161]
MTRNRLIRRHTGFTLIEVLVAVLVFGIIAAAASEIGSNYIGTFSRVQDRTLANWLAENIITEKRLETEFPGISEETEIIDDFANRRWQVETRVIGTEDPKVRRIEVTVSEFVDDDERQLATMTGFLGDY